MGSYFLLFEFMTYTFQNLPLTPTVAEQIILELFANKNQVSIREIRNTVGEYHAINGGTDGGNLISCVKKALNNLKIKNLAVNEIIKGYWSFPNNLDTPPENKINQFDQQTNVQISNIVTPKPERGQIYVYYFPAYKELSELKQEQFFPCKIGKTVIDHETRIKSQVGTALPERPVIMFSVITDIPTELETMIHRILKHKNRKHSLAAGNEWFLTNEEELRSIFSILDVQIG